MAVVVSNSIFRSGGGAATKSRKRWGRSSTARTGCSSRRPSGRQSGAAPSLRRPRPPLSASLSIAARKTPPPISTSPYFSFVVRGINDLWAFLEGWHLRRLGTRCAPQMEAYLMSCEHFFVLLCSVGFDFRVFWCGLVLCFGALDVL